MGRGLGAAGSLRVRCIMGFNSGPPITAAAYNQNVQLLQTAGYVVTAEDPNTWTRPWTAQMTMAKSDQPMYEYACHEGNYGLTNILAGARAKEAAEAAEKRSK